ncbi:MAG: renalase [Lentisphaeria bacterium]|jgi:renalase
MKVAIIGAGISGLATAQALTKRGIHVKVFEKSRGVGGRLATKRLDWGHIDIGAQYFTARSERFQKQVAKWQQDKVVACWQFTPHAMKNGDLIIRPDTSTRYVSVPDMASIAHALAHNIEICFNTRISALEFGANGWSLVTADGERISDCYDWVVVSLPAEQSGTLLAGTAIEHQIPEDIHQPCWALALATRGNVPREIQGIFGDDVVSWVSRLSARPQRQMSQSYDDLWMLHFSSEWSKINDKNTPVDITKTGLKWLSAMLEQHTPGPLELVQDYKHYWRYARVRTEKVKPSVIADKPSGVAAIGAWSAGGRVEGAYLSALEFVDHFFE